MSLCLKKILLLEKCHPRQVSFSNSDFLEWCLPRSQLYNVTALLNVHLITDSKVFHWRLSLFLAGIWVENWPHFI